MGEVNRFTPEQEATGATPAPQDTPRITHFLDVTDWRPAFICKAPAGSACSTGCVERCDAWGEGYGCDHDQTDPLGYCNVVTWLDEEDGQECAEDDHALLPLAIRWDGDRYRWRIVSAPAGPPLHEPTDRDADNVPSDEPWLHEDDETVEALHRVAADLNRQVPIDEDRVRAHAEEIHRVTCPLQSACAGIPSLADIEAARACVAVEDRHTAELRAEVERLRAFVVELREAVRALTSENRSMSDWVSQHAIRAEKAEATIARVDALAQQIQGWDLSQYTAMQIANRIRSVTSGGVALRGPKPTEDPT